MVNVSPILINHELTREVAKIRILNHEVAIASYFRNPMKIFFVKKWEHHSHADFVAYPLAKIEILNLNPASAGDESFHLVGWQDPRGDSLASLVHQFA
jgi:hypothetical protein